MFGSITYKTADLSPAGVDRNSVAVLLGGRRQFDQPGTNASDRFIYSNVYGADEQTLLRGDSVTLTFELTDADKVDLTVYLKVSRSARVKRRWQSDVYRKVLAEYRRPIDQRNQVKQAAYDQAFAAYQDELSRIRSTTVNESFEGASELEHRQIVLDSLRKRIVSTVLAELGQPINGDDQAADVNQEWPGFGLNVDANESLQASFALQNRDFYERASQVGFDQAALCQFIEQAFDWDNLSFVLYPGYWVTQKRLIETFARRSDADGVFTTFLRAGAARVLVPATPKFELACLYFLATGVPWLGSDVPALGDPLFVPVDEEVRQQQDNRLGATPVGESWEYLVPTTLKYLIGSTTDLPVINP